MEQPEVEFNDEKQTVFLRIPNEFKITSDGWDLFVPMSYRDFEDWLNAMRQELRMRRPKLNL